MILPIALQVAALLAHGFGAPPPRTPDECPRATLDCRRNPSNPSEYSCAVLAQYPSEERAPQYAWSVTGGRLLGDEKSPNVTVDAGGVEAEAVTVTAEVRWRKTPRACDASLSEKLALR